jgi:membrane fusion protein, multidrug efflux system
VNAKINAQVQGYLIKQNYQEGSLVKKGQVLFEIDPRPFQAALEQAKGELAIAEGQFYTARANLEKIRPLAKVNAVSKKDLDDAIGREASAGPRCKPPRRRCKQSRNRSQLHQDHLPH